MRESPCVGYLFHPWIVMGQQIVTTFGVASHWQISAHIIQQDRRESSNIT
jgi:hypothetical protein